MSTQINISKKITVKDEAVVLTSDVNSIDFTGAGVTATNVGNAVTVNIPSGGGGVTAVTATTPVVATGTTTPVISLASNYGDTQNPYGSKTANNILAAPNGTAGVPTFRAIVGADIPTLNQNTTGTAANVTGIVALANGGTGTATPSLVAGTNITITGSFPNQTIAASGAAGAVTQIVAGTNVTISPAGGTGIVTINSSGGGGGSTGLQSAVYSSLFSFYTSNALTASNTTTHNINSVSMNYVPYIPNTTFTCVEFRINVTTAQANGLGRICVYSSSNNLPANLLYSSTDLNCSTIGAKSVISSFVFTQGTTYWLGIQTNVANIVVTGLSGDACIPLTHFSYGTAITCWVQVSLTYANGAPSVASANSFLLNASPQILMKK